MKYLLWIMLATLAVFAGCKKDDAKSTPAVTTADVTTVAANSATSGGNVTGDGGSGVTKRGICWATHPTPTVTDSVTIDGGGTGTFTSSLTNLYSYTKYYVRAYAINASGTSYGAEINFTTSTGVPSVITTAVTGIAPLKAMGGGNVVSDGGSTVVARGIVWSLTEHPTIDNFKTVDGTGTGIFTDSLSPLGSQKTYYYRAYASNGLGTGYGVELTFTSVSADAVTDVDGNVYPYITIGTQSWMTKNLQVTHYRNGDPVTDGFDNGNFTFFVNAKTTLPTTGAFTYVNNNKSTNDHYGKLYDYLSMSDTRGICPTGWHVPSIDDWGALFIQEGFPADSTLRNYYNANSFFPASAYPIGNIGGKLMESGSSGLNLTLTGTFVAGALTINAFNTAGFYWTSTSLGFFVPSYDHTYVLHQIMPAAAGGAVFWNYSQNDASPGSVDGSFLVAIRCIKD